MGVLVPSGLASGEAAGASGLVDGEAVGGSGVISAGGIVEYTDDFNRATLGGDWNGGEIVDNKLSNVSAEWIVYAANTLPADHYVEADWISDNNSGGLIVRKPTADQTVQTGYLGRTNVANWQIYRVTAGSFTLLVSTAGPNFVAGGRTRLTAVGSTITLYEIVAGSPVQRATASDGTHTGLYVGFRPGFAQAGNDQWDNFTAGAA